MGGRNRQRPSSIRGEGCASCRFCRVCRHRWLPLLKDPCSLLPRLACGGRPPDAPTARSSEVADCRFCRKWNLTPGPIRPSPIRFAQHSPDAGYGRSLSPCAERGDTGADSAAKSGSQRIGRTQHSPARWPTRSVARMARDGEGSAPVNSGLFRTRIAPTLPAREGSCLICPAMCPAAAGAVPAPHATHARCDAPMCRHLAGFPAILKRSDWIAANEGR